MVLSLTETKQENFYKNKGASGEQYVAKALLQLGLNVITVGGALKFAIDGFKFFCADLLCFGNGKTFWVQVKNKEPRLFYADTGLEKWRFDNLLWMQENSSIPVLLLFTEKSGKIYGEWVEKIKEEVHYGYNSKANCEMVYFWLSDLKDIKELINNDDNEQYCNNWNGY